MLIKEEISGELSAQINQLIQDEILHFTCQLFIRENKMMKPYGSGILATINNSNYILTASHVIDYFMEDENSTEDLFIRKGGGYVAIKGDFKGTVISMSDGIDLAYIKIENELFEAVKYNYKFLPLSKFRKHVKLIPAAQYCVLGFPEVNVKHEDDKMHTGASVKLPV